MPAVPAGEAGQILGRIFIGGQAPVQHRRDLVAVPQDVRTGQIAVVDHPGRSRLSGQGTNEGARVSPDRRGQPRHRLLGKDVIPAVTAAECACRRQQMTDRFGVDRMNRLETGPQHGRISRPRPACVTSQPAHPDAGHAVHRNRSSPRARDLETVAPAARRLAAGPVVGRPRARRCARSGPRCRCPVRQVSMIRSAPTRWRRCDTDRPPQPAQQQLRPAPYWHQAPRSGFLRAPQHAFRSQRSCHHRRRSRRPTATHKCASGSLTGRTVFDRSTAKGLIRHA